MLPWMMLRQPCLASSSGWLISVVFVIIILIPKKGIRHSGVYIARLKLKKLIKIKYQKMNVTILHNSCTESGSAERVVLKQAT
jgi:hypothetical protein